MTAADANTSQTPPPPSSTLSQVLFASRGLAILQVALIHTVGVTSSDALQEIYGASSPWLARVAAFIHLYNMPVMLIGSGIAVATFGGRRETWAKFMRKRVTRLLLPLAIWAPLFLTLQAWRHGALADLSAGGLARSILLPFSIFWFFHALFFATVLARLWKQLGFGTNLAFAASLALYLVVNVWHLQAPSPFGDYVYFFGFWNIFFALGQLLHSLPGQIVAEGGRQRALLVCAAALVLCLAEIQFKGFEGSITAFVLIPFVAVAAWTLQFFLSMGALALARDLRWVQRGFDALAYCGSKSLVIFLFHVQALGVARSMTQRLAPNAVGINVAVGTLFAVILPLIVYRVLKPYSWFALTIGEPLTGRCHTSEANPLQRRWQRSEVLQKWTHRPARDDEERRAKPSPASRVRGRGHWLRHPVRHAVAPLSTFRAGWR